VSSSLTLTISIQDGEIFGEKLQFVSENFLLVPLFFYASIVVFHLKVIIDNWISFLTYVYHSYVVET
jgi:hypothetical protein